MEERGVCEFYRELSGSSDRKRPLSFIDLLEVKTIKGHRPCYCGSAKQLQSQWRTTRRLVSQYAVRFGGWHSTRSIVARQRRLGFP